jgi:acyl-coenzyme A thioesterase PaaI-like protein
VDDVIIQQHYNDTTAVCYGCGKHNAQGLHVQTHWNGTEGISHFKPQPYHTAFPGVVYGGLLASLIDCHSIGTAIAAMHDAEQQPYGSEPEITCVTGQLNITYLKPTPIDAELTLRARVKELTNRKAIIMTSIYAGELETVRAEVIAIRVSARQLDALKSDSE